MLSGLKFIPRDQVGKVSLKCFFYDVIKQRRISTNQVYACSHIFLIMDLLLHQHLLEYSFMLRAHI